MAASSRSTEPSIAGRGRPRVVIASRLFAPEVGAAAFRLRALADALARDGAAVRVATTRPPRGMTTGASVEGGTTPDPVEISRFPVLRDAGGNVRGYLQYLSFDIPLFFRLLGRRADIVVAEPPPTTGVVVAITSWLKRRPFVYYAADVWSDAIAAMGGPRAVVAVMTRVERFVLRRAALVLAVSDGVAVKVRGLGATRVVVVGNGIDTSVFCIEGSSVADPAPYFVYTGTMSEWQGAGIFIDAMAILLRQHPGARLHFFGQGSDEAALRARARQVAPASVTFHGVVSPAETARWLRSSTASLVSIVPGQGYDFAKPTKIYAASACGTPVIFAGTGAGAEVVERGELGEMSDFSADAVARAMSRAIAHETAGTSAARRDARSAWASDNASLDSLATVAARHVLSVRPAV